MSGAPSTTIERIGDLVYADGRPLPHQPIYDHDDGLDQWVWSAQIDMENGTNLVLRARTDGRFTVSLWASAPEGQIDPAAKIQRRNGEMVVVPLVGLSEILDGWQCDDVDGAEVWYYVRWIGKMPLVHPTARMTGRRAW